MAHKVMRVYVLVEDVTDEGRVVFPGKQASMSWLLGGDKLGLEFNRNDLSGVMDGLLRAVGVE